MQILQSVAFGMSSRLISGSWSKKFSPARMSARRASLIRPVNRPGITGAGPASLSGAMNMDSWNEVSGNKDSWWYSPVSNRLIMGFSRPACMGGAGIGSCVKLPDGLGISGHSIPRGWDREPGLSSTSGTWDGEPGMLSEESSWCSPVNKRPKTPACMGGCTGKRLGGNLPGMWRVELSWSSPV